MSVKENRKSNLCPVLRYCSVLMSVLIICACDSVSDLNLNTCSDLSTSDEAEVIINQNHKIAGRWALQIYDLFSVPCSDEQDRRSVNLKGFDIGPLILETEGDKILYSLGEVKREEAGEWRIGAGLIIYINLDESDEMLSELIGKSLGREFSSSILKLRFNQEPNRMEAGASKLLGTAFLITNENEISYHGSFSLSELELD